MGQDGSILPLVSPTALLAHAAGPVKPGNWWTVWNVDLLILLNLGFLAWLYSLGLVRLWRKVGAGNGIPRWRGAAFLSSLVILFVALISPLDPLSDELLSVHMIQHMLLIMVAAPLLVLGAPALVLAWGLAGVASEQWSTKRNSFLRGAFHLSQTTWLWQPLFVWFLYALTLWTWHLPLLYEAALRDPLIHDVEHLSFFLVACLFWRVVLDPISRQRLHPLSAVPYLFTTSLHSSVLGIFMTLSPRTWYADYLGRTSTWGLTELEDQQLAGLIMWVPACLIYLVIAALLFGCWLSQISSAAPGQVTGGRQAAKGGSPA